MQVDALKALHKKSVRFVFRATPKAFTHHTTSQKCGQAQGGAQIIPTKPAAAFLVRAAFKDLEPGKGDYTAHAQDKDLKAHRSHCTDLCAKRKRNRL